MSLRVTELWGKVIPAKSKLTLTGTKLELGLAKKSKVQWKTLEAKEDGASVLFGMPEKMQKIWPSEIHEILPEEVKEIVNHIPKKCAVVPDTPDDPESDLDMDDIAETEWS